MYVYKQTEQSLWTVGYYAPSGEWEPESDHDTPEAAGNRALLLNGGVPNTVTEDDLTAVMKLWRDTHEKIGQLEARIAALEKQLDHLGDVVGGVQETGGVYDRL